MTRANTEADFWRRTAMVGGCLVWTGSLAGNGYGEVRWSGKRISTHRLAWELANGPVPEGMRVLHHCDNPPCCKTDPDERYPDGHLFLGTQSENMSDMMAKGRHSRESTLGQPRNVGASNPSAKLTPSQVVEIRRRVAAGESHRTLAPLFGVTYQTIGKVARRQKWGSVPD